MKRDLFPIEENETTSTGDAIDGAECRHMESTLCVLPYRKYRLKMP